MNNVTLQGKIATRPELSYTQDGSKQYTTFTLLFPALKADDDAGTMNVTVWGEQAQSATNYQLDQDVIIEGRVNVRKVEREGYSENVAQLIASRIHLISATTPAQATPVAAKAKAPAAQAKTPVTPVAAMAGASVGRAKAEVAPEINYEDIPF